MLHLHAGAPQQVDAVGEPVLLGIDHAPYACLDDEFGTLDAGRGGDVERGLVAVVAAARQFGDGVGLGVEHVGVRPRRRSQIRSACRCSRR
mgnify:CR=1 FL=1